MRMGAKKLSALFAVLEDKHTPISSNTITLALLDVRMSASSNSKSTDPKHAASNTIEEVCTLDLKDLMYWESSGTCGAGEACTNTTTRLYPNRYACIDCGCTVHPNCAIRIQHSNFLKQAFAGEKMQQPYLYLCADCCKSMTGFDYNENQVSFEL
jgi:hypothetical protein